MHAIENRLVGNITAVTVGNRHAQHLPVLIGCHERRPYALDAQMNPSAAEFEHTVLDQCARQESCFGKNLKAVANAQHKPAAFANAVTARITGENRAIDPDRR